MVDLYNNSRVGDHNLDNFGKVGGFFQFSDSSAVYGISNNHVIAELNGNGCKIGNPIYYVPDRKYQVGTLTHWFQLDPNKINYHDVALFELGPNINYQWITRPLGFLPPLVNGHVKLERRGHPLRTGIIRGIGKENVLFSYNDTDYSFSNLIQIESLDEYAFSMHGDSGSLILSETNGIVGIILGGNGDNFSYAIPFVGGILTKLGLQIT